MITEKQQRVAQIIDKLRGFSNLTQEERIDKLKEIYNEWDNNYLTSQHHNLCQECNDNNQYCSILYEKIPFEIFAKGICYKCQKHKMVFHTFLYRHIVIRYGFIIEDWKKVKFHLTFLK